MDAYKLFASSLGIRPGREAHARIVWIERHDERVRPKCDVNARRARFHPDPARAEQNGLENPFWEVRWDFVLAPKKLEAGWMLGSTNSVNRRSAST
jgi:hypothetical protein